MSHNEVKLKSSVILSVGTQCAYFVLIACVYFTGLDAFGLSFSRIQAMPATIGRIFLSYLGVIVLLYCIFYPYAERSFYQSIRSFLYMLGFIVITIIAIYFLNDELWSYLRTFDEKSPVFIGIHLLMTITSYVWISLFIMAYFGYSEEVTNRTKVLVLALGPLLVAIFYLLLIEATKQTVLGLELNLYGWPRWFRCFLASFAILLTANLLIILNHMSFNKNILYKSIIVIGFILSISLFIYININVVFERYFTMMYFDFPGFIK